MKELKLLPYDIFKPVSGYEDLYEVSNVRRVGVKGISLPVAEIKRNPLTDIYGNIINNLYKNLNIN